MKNEDTNGEKGQNHEFFFYILVYMVQIFHICTTKLNLNPQTNHK